MANVGAPVRQFGKGRAYVVITAGSLLVVFGIGLIVLMSSLRPSMTIPAATADAFFGRLDMGFGMIAVSGVLAVINGTRILRTGRPSMPLTLAVVLIFAVAAFIVSSATKILPNS